MTKEWGRGRRGEAGENEEGWGKEKEGGGSGKGRIGGKVE